MSVSEEYLEMVTALEEAEEKAELLELDVAFHKARVRKIEQENASLKAVLGQVKETMDDEYSEAISTLCGYFHPASKAIREVAAILSSAPKPLAVVDGRKFVINDEWGEVWAIDVGDTINRLPSGELTVVVLEKGGE